MLRIEVARESAATAARQPRLEARPVGKARKAVQHHSVDKVRQFRRGSEACLPTHPNTIGVERALKVACRVQLHRM